MVNQAPSFLGSRQENEVIRSQLDQDYNTFRAQYTDLNDYIMPSRARFFISDSNRGDRRNHKIYDPTAYFAARTLSSGMMAGITSPARRWFKLDSPDPGISGAEHVKEWLEVVADRMSQVFNKSNLYNVLPSLYLDLGTFGTAAMMMEEDLDEVVRFYSFEIGSFRIAKDYRGRVNVFYREFRMTVRQLVEKFGKVDDQGNPDWSNFSVHVKNLWDQKQFESWIDVCHMIKPNQNHDPNKLDSKFKKYSSQYYERGTSASGNNGTSVSPDGNKYLRESGYDFFPVLCPRWMVTGQDVYGTDCPGMISIGDVKQLQHGEKRGLQAIDKKVNPAMTASSNLKTAKTSIVSGDVTYLDDNEHFKAAHEVQLSLAELENKQAQVRGRIKEAFYADLFLALANNDRSGITATEVKEIKEEKLLAIGPVLEQLNQDVLDPLIDNSFFLMNKQGLIPTPPEELQGRDIKVEYISVMAQAQKLIGIAGMERFAGFAQGVLSQNPDSRRKINFNAILDVYGEAVGISPKIINSDEKVKEIEDAQQRQQQAAAQMQAIQQGSAAAKNLSQADTSGDNALTRLMAQGQAGSVVPNA